MNSEIYMSVVDTVGPHLVRIAHENAGRVESPTSYRAGVERKTPDPEFDLTINLRAIKGINPKKGIDRKFVTEVRNSLSLLCRSGIHRVSHDGRDTLSVRFYDNAVRFLDKGKTLVIDYKEYKPYYFGLENFDREPTP